MLNKNVFNFSSQYDGKVWLPVLFLKLAILTKLFGVIVQKKRVCVL